VPHVLTSAEGNASVISNSTKINSLFSKGILGFHTSIHTTPIEVKLGM